MHKDNKVNKRFIPWTLFGGAEEIEHGGNCHMKASF